MILQLYGLVKVEWQIKYFISPLAEDPWKPDLARCSLSVRGSQPKSTINLWSTDQFKVTRQFEKSISQDVQSAGWWLQGGGSGPFCLD